jgi:hypothetical protein
MVSAAGVVQNARKSRNTEKVCGNVHGSKLSGVEADQDQELQSFGGTA